MVALMPCMLHAQITPNTASEHLYKMMPDGSVPYYGFSTNVNSTYTVTYAVSDSGHFFQFNSRSNGYLYMSVIEIPDSMNVKAMSPCDGNRVYICGQTNSEYGFFGLLTLSPEDGIITRTTFNYIIFQRVKDTYKLSAYKDQYNGEYYIAAIGTSIDNQDVIIQVYESGTSPFFHWYYTVEPSPYVSKLYDVTSTKRLFAFVGIGQNSDEYIVVTSPHQAGIYEAHYFVPIDGDISNTAEKYFSIMALEEDSFAVSYMTIKDNDQQKLHIDILDYDFPRTLYRYETRVPLKSILNDMVYLEDSSRLAVLHTDDVSQQFVTLIEPNNPLLFVSISLYPDYGTYPFIAKQSGNHILLGSGTDEWYQYSAIQYPEHCLDYLGVLIAECSEITLTRRLESYDWIETGNTDQALRLRNTIVNNSLRVCHKLIPHDHDE